MEGFEPGAAANSTPTPADVHNPGLTFIPLKNLQNYRICHVLM
jgi:hypothetical protein